MTIARGESGPPAKRPNPLMRVEFAAGIRGACVETKWYLAKSILAEQGEWRFKDSYQSARVMIVDSG